jgi:hypothetical protein
MTIFSRQLLCDAADRFNIDRPVARFSCLVQILPLRPQMLRTRPLSGVWLVISLVARIISRWKSDDRPVASDE